MGPYLLVPTTPKKLLDAATTGNGSVFLPRGQVARVTVILQSTGTTSGGAVSIEECFFEDIGTSPGVEYAGTWSLITPAVSASTFTGGAQIVVHISGSVWALRVRISSTITGGGTVTVVHRRRSRLGRSARS